MSVSLEYRSKVAQELGDLIHVIRFNGSILKYPATVEVVQNVVTVTTETLSGIESITKIECFDEEMGLISHKNLNIELSPDKVIDFVYSWEVNA